MLSRQHVIAIASGFCVGGALWVLWRHWRAHTRSVDADESSPQGPASASRTDPRADAASDAAQAHVASTAPLRAPSAISDTPELRREQLSRNRQFFGDGQDAVEQAYVVVVGVGGVGSHAAHMLARAGVARLRLIDFDNVSLSSLNRHATARRADVGTRKVEAMRRAFAEIVPSCHVDAIPRMFDAEHAQELLLSGGRPDFVCDCIDDRDTKAALVAACKQAGLRVVCSLGAGGKADPTTLRITDLAHVPAERMGTVLRIGLRKLGIEPVQAPRTGDAAGGSSAASSGGRPDRRAPDMNSMPTAMNEPPLEYGVPCVYSIEPPRATLLPLEMSAEAGEKADDFGAVAGLRVRIMPVLGTMPALFGQAMAAFVLCDLAGSHHALETGPAYMETAPFPAGAILALLNQFAVRERVVYSHASTSIGMEEVAFIANTLWRGRSAFSTHRYSQKGAKLCLDVLYPHRPVTASNVALVTAQQRDEFSAAARDAVRGAHNDEEADAAVENLILESYGQYALERVRSRVAWAKSLGY